MKIENSLIENKEAYVWGALSFRHMVSYVSRAIFIINIKMYFNIFHIWKKKSSLDTRPQPHFTYLFSSELFKMTFSHISTSSPPTLPNKPPPIHRTPLNKLSINVISGLHYSQVSETQVSQSRTQSPIQTIKHPKLTQVLGRHMRLRCKVIKLCWFHLTKKDRVTSTNTQVTLIST